MMLKGREFFARVIALLIMIGLPGAALGYQYKLRPQLPSANVIEIRAAAPEQGGFFPDAIQVEAGQTVTLRFTAVDVTHGIAIGPGLEVDLGQVDPGKTKEITLTFERAGTYTFYCTSWCSPNHWRMRGVIDVRDQQNTLSNIVRDPVIQALVEEGVDIDANLHNQDHNPNPFVLAGTPSATRGQLLIETLSIPPELWDANWRMRHRPLDALDLLTEANPRADQMDLVDVVAYLWTLTLENPPLPQLSERYNNNCAACHGQNGNGAGFAAVYTAEQPAAFADPAYMFTLRSDVLYAKIRRGGMGTDMPNFGTLFTPDETWTIVNYLWTLTFQNEPNNNLRITTESGYEP